MTEDEWLNLSNGKLIGQLPEFSRLARRRRRLVLCAVCRLLWTEVPTEARITIETVENYLDGFVSMEQLEQASRQHAIAHELIVQTAIRDNAYRLSTLAGHAVYPGNKVRVIDGWNKASRQAVATALRDVCRTYFLWIKMNPAWRTSTTIGIAQGIYDDRAFDRMPILADALQDAGCENAEILTHCRGEGPHVHGCWVVDLVLGKE